MGDYRFQVNLGGMIEILSDHLYSSPDVYIRELLQNGVDAITARVIWERETAEESGADSSAVMNQRPGADPSAAMNQTPGAAPSEEMNLRAGADPSTGM